MQSFKWAVFKIFMLFQTHIARFKLLFLRTVLVFPVLLHRVFFLGGTDADWLRGLNREQAERMREGEDRGKTWRP